jgi:hypothetical protein
MTHHLLYLLEACCDLKDRYDPRAALAIIEGRAPLGEAPESWSDAMSALRSRAS